jgi:hypothetical protein
MRRPKAAFRLRSKMQRCRKNVGTPVSVPSTLSKLCVVLLLCLGGIPRAHAGATLLLEEPYSYDGAFAGTGHAAVYLDHVCAASPVELRACAPGEDGVVLSRYKAVAGYDWIAIPLVPYLYAVDERENIPLFADARLVAFLRDQYRRKYLEALAPDRADGGSPAGDWYELVGSAYDRTTFAFEIETSARQDALLIDKFNSGSNRKRYSFIKHNCADFVREVVDFYYPRALHRSLIGDLGVTTPKQIAKTLAQYGRRHPELQTADYVIPQVPGTIRRSKPVHGVLESALTAKKYMVPLLLLHPYVSGGLLAAYFGHGRFDPARHALVLDSSSRLDAPLTAADRRFGQSRLEELTRSSSALVREGKNWEGVQSSAEPALDPQGQPVIKVSSGADVAQVGIARSNVLSASESSELAAQLVEARLRQELRRSASPKTAQRDVADDLSLLQQLLAETRETVALASTANAGRSQAPASEHLSGTSTETPE